MSQAPGSPRYGEYTPYAEPYEPFGQPNLPRQDTADDAASTSVFPGDGPGDIRRTSLDGQG
ncbi:hypothetical protein, partial [Streptomyces sp. NPDC029704]|uniref:hypothetical protein n=1 Tax=Streptomyces sp. NPDC029704 TaxID=3156920 RepID=UPI0033CCF334